MVAACLMAGPLVAAALQPASSGIVVDGYARFTVITPTLMRLEYSGNRTFVDRRSYFAWERDVPPPPFTVQRTGGRLSITTSRMELTWTRGTHDFDAADLSIAFRNADGGWQTWRPGEKQSGNLGGTLENLDGASGAEPLPDGVVSRDGWFLYRDHTFLVSDGAHPWMQARSKDDDHDWYFFGYGTGDYRAALEDLTTVSGSIPIPPRYMLGSWRSRYFSYTQHEFQQLVLDYDAHRFPLDVLVMDMGWHTTPHWGSLDWNRELIPDPTAMLQWMHAHRLHVTLNWHPDDGVGPWYSQYAELCRALGMDPAAKKVIPFEDTNETFMRNYYKLLMDPLERQGVDFWWLDGGVHLGWDNALDFWDVGRAGSGRRGASFSRWGGWGDQRYPIWFSGDTSALWRTLRFEVPFTATAGNVGADYWSNDISGFRMKIPNAELFTRWVEFGALSPVFRTHGESEFGNYRIPWDYGDQAETASRRAYELRDKLFPYIYSSAYLTWKTSLPLSRPLYLDYPTEQQAYTHPEEYEFGPDLLVAPIVTRGMGGAWLGATDMWFPGGAWWNLLTGESVTDRGNHTILATADEMPVYARGGVPLPMQRVTPRMAGEAANPLVVTVYPGADGEFTLYEDDGTSPAYLKGRYALTPLRYRNQGSQGVAITVGSAKGSYAGQPRSRQIVVRLPVTAHPANVTANGREVPESSSADPGYTYDPVSATTEIRMPEEPIQQQVEVSVRFRGSARVRGLIPDVVNRIAIVQRALAGAGELRAGWKFALQAELFHLQTLQSRAEQELGPTTAQEVQAGLQSAAEEQAAIQNQLEEYRGTQARAAAFALADAYVDASVRVRKADEGLMAFDAPRYRKRYGQPGDVSGYNSGLLLRVLTPGGAGGDSLKVQVAGLGNRSFTLPNDRVASWAYLPFSRATRHPIYHLRGTATVSLNAGDSQRALTRDFDLRSELLDQWVLLGPFDKAKTPEIGGQAITAATLRLTYAGRNGKRVSWQTWQEARGDQGNEQGRDYLQTMQRWIDLYTVYPSDDAAAVAVTWVEAPRAMNVKLRVRHNAGIAVWINQRAVVDAEGARGVADLKDPPPDTVEVNLQKGWNEIAIRTEDAQGDWGFSLRLALPAGVICAQSDQPPAPVVSQAPTS
jgi:hypothetical protein